MIVDTLVKSPWHRSAAGFDSLSNWTHGRLGVVQQVIPHPVIDFGQVRHSLAIQDVQRLGAMLYVVRTTVRIVPPIDLRTL